MNFQINLKVTKMTKLKCETIKNHNTYDYKMKLIIHVVLFIVRLLKTI